jgi:hypothetical protein
MEGLQLEWGKVAVEEKNVMRGSVDVYGRGSIGAE